MSEPTSRQTTVVLDGTAPRPAGSRPCLVVIAGRGIGRQIELGDEPIEIGRSESATLMLDTDNVSRRHARVQHVLGRFTINDLQSTNGTYVNDLRVEVHTLCDGDRIRIGKTVLKYMENDVEAAYHKELLDRARLDPLTGAYDKRHFEERLRAEVERSRTSGRPLSLILFDIDHFKSINDTHGHAAGDAVLKGVCEVVRAGLPAGAALCRVGGEEFAVLVPGADNAEAVSIAERLRQAVGRAAFPFQDREIPVTTSAGVAELDGKGDQPDTFYGRADQRLYEAKRAGRDRVI